MGTALSLLLDRDLRQYAQMTANHIFQAPRLSTRPAINDNSMEAKMETILLMIAIDFHEQARAEVARLVLSCTKLKAAGVDCELLEKRLEKAREVERCIRDEMLRCPTEYIQNAAAKVVHLRRTFTQDHATSEAGGR
jgi:hypothetical protein